MPKLNWREWAEWSKRMAESPLWSPLTRELLMRDYEHGIARAEEEEKQCQS